MGVTPRIKPTGLGMSLLLFSISPVLLLVVRHWLVPAFLAATGYLFLVGYLIPYDITLLIIFIAGLAAYVWDRNEFDRAAFARRIGCGR